MKKHYLLIKNFYPMKNFLLSIVTLLCFCCFNSVNAQDDGSLVNTCETSYLCDGTSTIGNAGWGSDCPDGSDELLSYCCDAANGSFSAYSTNSFGISACDAYYNPPVATECTDDLIVFSIFESYGDGGTATLSLNGEVVVENVSYGSASNFASVCVDLSACNTVSFSGNEYYSSELSWSCLLYTSDAADE